MKNQTLLYVMSEEIPCDDIRSILADAKKRHVRMVCLILSMLPQQPVNAYGYFPYDGGAIAKQWSETVEKTRAALEDARSRVERQLIESGVAGDVQAIHCSQSDIATLIPPRALLADFAMISPNLREENPALFQSIAHSILFRSPSGLFLNKNTVKAPYKVFVAWNGELPSARAIQKAVPYLASAEEVIIGIVDPIFASDRNGEDPGADVARWLSHQGCRVTVQQYPSGELNIATVLSKRAAEAGSDLFVMGAYGRSKLREVVFGGTTQTMLEERDLPLLLVH